MAAAAMRRLPVFEEPPRAPAQPRLFALPGGAAEAPAVEAPVLEAPVLEAPAVEATLDAILSGTWNELAAGVVATCPVCTAGMSPRWSAGAGAVGGRCGSCGTTLE